MLVIINADDLGFNVTCNDVIFDLMVQGRITSATILANCPGTEDALKRARQFPQCSFGIHLNATVSRPLRNDAGLGPILDADGQFRRNLATIRLSQAMRRALFVEFSAQMERLLAAGIPVSHIDSHHHVHNLPSVFPVLKAVQRRYGIHKVRISQNLYAPGYRLRADLRVKKMLYNWALRNWYRTKTTDGFTDLRTFCGLSRTTALRLRTLEIMVHPGPPSYQEETELLRSSWMQDVPGVIQPINYHHL